MIKKNYNFNLAKYKNSCILIVAEFDTKLNDVYNIAFAAYRTGTEFVFVMCKNNKLLLSLGKYRNLIAKRLQFDENILRKITCCILLGNNQINKNKYINKWSEQFNFKIVYCNYIALRTPKDECYLINYNNANNLLKIAYGRDMSINTVKFENDGMYLKFIGIFASAVSIFPKKFNVIEFIKWMMT